MALPAGNYQALRVLIGEAEGHNWWCVVFPSLCLPAVSEDSLAAPALPVPGEVSFHVPQLFQRSLSRVPLRFQRCLLHKKLCDSGLDRLRLPARLLLADRLPLQFRLEASFSPSRAVIRPRAASISASIC